MTPTTPTPASPTAGTPTAGTPTTGTGPSGRGTTDGWSGGAEGLVEIVEVAPRDGLQSDPSHLSTDQKVALVGRLVGAGLRRVETASFVNPRRVPQMADAEEVMERLNSAGGIPDREECSFIGLVLNTQGLERAVRSGVDEVNFVVVCTDGFARANQGTDTAGLLAQWTEVAAGARAAGLRTSVTLSATFGCPYEGEVSLDRIRWVLEHIAADPPDEVALADSIGAAVPSDVTARVAAAAEVLDGISLRCHFHNTRNTGLANAVAAIGAGVRVLDSSAGGIGGCPFAPKATGNIPTEDLVYLLHRMGHPTGVDLDSLCALVPWLEAQLGHPAPGLLSKAGPFPSPAG